MCGITGICAFNEIGRFSMINLSKANDTLEKRGPNYGDTFISHYVGLGHRRLSILDTSPLGNQPMQSADRRFTIVFNGEIFNYPILKKALEDKGHSFISQTDTEVLLKLYELEGESCLQKLNGFFALAIFDAQENTVFLARDRFGVKPLLYSIDEDKIVFASEIKALLAFGIEKKLDFQSLNAYLQLNYIPAPYTIFENVKKVKEGHYIFIKNGKVEEKKFYEIPKNTIAADIKKQEYTLLSYENQQKKLAELLENAVQRRLISDVPLGSFLSGGIDSSIVAGLASRHTEHLSTFSVGYRDEPFFDETKYANLVAKHFKTNHTVFSLSNDDLYEHLDEILDYLDEPFADSSAIAVYILSKRTRKKVTVALSGDGADEIFGGYNKHQAEFKVRENGFLAQMVNNLSGLWDKLPKSRNSFIGNKVRQFARFAEGAKHTPKERYWRWASFATQEDVRKILSEKSRQSLDNETNTVSFDERKKEILSFLQDNHTETEQMNEFLYTDMKLVLPNDMLTKVDMMSMANGLEVRTPFLDYEVVDFAFTLPISSKITGKMKKKIVQDTFRKMLPKELYNRPKQGFEVPLLKWFQTELKSKITDDLLSDTFVEQQGIFSVDEVRKLKEKLFSDNPEDSHARVWGLIVFQTWWKKYF